MLAVESRKFCCCLPVRLGVFVLSLVAMIGGSIIAAVGWVSVSQLSLNPVEITDEIALWVHSTIFTLLGFLGMLGFVGSLSKSRGAVVAFSIGIACHLGLSIASGAFSMYAIFKQPAKEAVEACLKGKTDAESIQVCETGMSLVRGAFVVIYIVAWLIELYAYFIVSRYVAQLDEEEFASMQPILPISVNDRDIKSKHQTYNGYPKHFTYSAYAGGNTPPSTRAPSIPPLPIERENSYQAARDTFAPSVLSYQPTVYHGRDTVYTDPKSERASQEEIPPVPSWPPREAYGVSRGRDAA